MPLVAWFIFEACSYFQLFNQTEFKGRCAVVTSYNPHGSDISLEDTGATSETDKETIFRIYEEILKDVEAQPNKSKTEVYEDNVKKLFKRALEHENFNCC